MTILARWLFRLLGVIAGLAVIAVFVAWQMLRGSLPQLEGEMASDAVGDRVSIARDGAGIPVISGSSRADVAFATGFAHGQDRWFQMDLLRRNSAGELAALVGPVALDHDRRVRLHRFRARAARWAADLDDQARELLEAYAAGVNAARDAMSTRPFEYIVLRAEVQPWRPEDTFLVAATMFLDLNDELAERDAQRGLAARVLPPEVFAWLYPDGTPWDAPLQGEPRGAGEIPSAAVYDLRDVEARPPGEKIDERDELPGSNNWAVSGELTADGRAIVANDMHLGLRVPTIYYRARLRVGDELDISGVTLPGTPLVIAGSNGRIAWGFTNSYGDWSDAIVVHAGSEDDSYLAPAGERRFERHEEIIEVRGAPSETLVVRETVWGPVREDFRHPQGEIAVAWTAHRPGGINVRQFELEQLQSVDEALRLAPELGMPPQNLVVGDADGNIAWTIAGRIPLRDGYDPGLPADGRQYAGFTGWVDAADYPRVVNPAGGRIWTANSRVVDGADLAVVGDSGYALGARSRQIRDGLAARDRFVPADMLAVHLDDRALFLQRWRDLLLALLDDEAVAARPARAEYRRLVENWVPRASIDSTGYRLVRAFRDEVSARVFDMLMTPVRNAYPFDVPLRRSRQFEAPLWAVVNARPPHLLTKNAGSWRGLLLAALDASQEELERLPGDLAARTWGERNTARIRHPLSHGLPWLSRWLDMPRVPLPGGRDMPRVQGPAFGASERFAVAPGAEADGYLHVPGGQSGHPLSPWYRTGYADWAAGRPSAFLPGTPMHRLDILPAAP